MHDVLFISIQWTRTCKVTYHDRKLDNWWLQKEKSMEGRGCRKELQSDTRNHLGELHVFIILIMVIVSWVYTYVYCCQIIHFNYVQYIVCQIYPNKPVTTNKHKWHTHTHTYSKDLFKKGEIEIWNYKVKRIGNPVENKW